MGILLGTILYPSISETKRHRYIVWGARMVALILVIVAFVLTTRNFCEYEFSYIAPSSRGDSITAAGDVKLPLDMVSG